jgi:hypothetical protein
MTLDQTERYLAALDAMAKALDTLGGNVGFVGLVIAAMLLFKKMG